MIKIQSLAILIVLIFFSCKRNIVNSNEQVLKRNIYQTSDYDKQDKDTIPNSDLEFFNSLNILGKGLVRVNSEKSFVVIKDNKRLIENIYYPNASPIFFKPDYDIFYLVCISEDKLNYTIQFDKEDIALLPKNKDAEFISWSNFLLNTTGISNLDWKQNPLKEKHNPNSITIKTDEEDVFKVNKVYDDWIEISNENNSIRGWLRWRNRNNLLVEIYLLI